jgi:hypothetical protein
MSTPENESPSGRSAVDRVKEHLRTMIDQFRALLAERRAARDKRSHGTRVETDRE